MMTLVRILYQHAQAQPTGLALVSEDDVVSWAELADRIRRAAVLLQSIGVRKGDRVMLAASSTTAFVSGYFATHHIGAVALPIDPRSPATRLEDIARRAEPRAVFLARPARVADFPVFDIEALRDSDTTSHIAGEPVAHDPDDIADILFTSGTTGRPKGVMLSHGAIVAAARNINAFVGNAPGDREVAPLPLSHSFGLGRLRCQVLAGGSLLLVNGFGMPGRLFNMMERYEASGLSSVPAGFEVILRTTGDRLADFAERLRWVEIGSAAMPLPRKQQLMQLLPKTRLCMHYGLTEASRSAFIEFHTAGEHLDTIGQATPGVGIRVVDDRWQDVPTGVRGQLAIQGPTLMTGYWRDDAMTDSVLVDGWLATGDVGRRNTDGWLTLDGREKDMINVGGREVCPTEVERVLEELPEISACACVGIPDPQGIAGHVVKAFLVASPGAQLPTRAELAKYLSGHLEPYKQPNDFEWIDDIPRTFNGKVQRGVLAARG
jgi:long-chain acyl-CoA synthetase